MSFELHNAAKTGNLKLVESLIENGADINLIDSAGNTPLHKAIQGYSIGIEDCIEIVKRLVAEEKIKLELINAKGETPLLSASFKGAAEIVKILLENKANANVTSNQDYITFPVTPLVWACYLGYVEIAKLLIEHGANINIISMAGKTPIVLACSRGLTEVAELLLKKGVNIKETLLQEMHDAMEELNNFPNKSDRLIEMTNLILPILLSKYPTLAQPSYILENAELSSIWDKQSKKINPLASKFFEPPNIASNDVEAVKAASTVAQVSR